MGTCNYTEANEKLIESAFAYIGIRVLLQKGSAAERGRIAELDQFFGREQGFTAPAPEDTYARFGDYLDKLEEYYDAWTADASYMPGFGAANCTFDWPKIACAIWVLDSMPMEARAALLDAQSKGDAAFDKVLAVSPCSTFQNDGMYRTRLPSNFGTATTPPTPGAAETKKTATWKYALGGLGALAVVGLVVSAASKE